MEEWWRRLARTALRVAGQASRIQRHAEQLNVTNYYLQMRVGGPKAAKRPRPERATHPRHSTRYDRECRLSLSVARRLRPRSGRSATSFPLTLKAEGVLSIKRAHSESSKRSRCCKAAVLRSPDRATTSPRSEGEDLRFERNARRLGPPRAVSQVGATVFQRKASNALKGKAVLSAGKVRALKAPSTGACFRHSKAPC